MKGQYTSVEVAHQSEFNLKTVYVLLNIENYVVFIIVVFELLLLFLNP